jgi:hypothetical protein
MEHLLVKLFLDHLRKRLKTKPRLSWIFRAPAGPLLFWLYFKVIFFQAWGKVREPWERNACAVLVVAGFWISLISLADLIAWAYYLVHGRREMTMDHQAELGNER